MTLNEHAVRKFLRLKCRWLVQALLQLTDAFYHANRHFQNVLSDIYLFGRHHRDLANVFFWWVVIDWPPFFSLLPLLLPLLLCTLPILPHLAYSLHPSVLLQMRVRYIACYPLFIRIDLIRPLIFCYQSARCAERCPGAAFQAGIHRDMPIARTQTCIYSCIKTLYTRLQKWPPCRSTTPKLQGTRQRLVARKLQNFQTHYFVLLSMARHCARCGMAMVLTRTLQRSMISGWQMLQLRAVCVYSHNFFPVTAF